VIWRLTGDSKPLDGAELGETETYLLTIHIAMGIPIHMKRRAYSTSEVAKAIGVSKNTVLRWLYAGKVAEPKTAIFGGVESRVWSDADLARAKQFKEEHYRKRF
jgi:hypothetical protein